MIRNFANKIAQDVYYKGSSKSLPTELHARAKALLDIMVEADSPSELVARGTPPSLRLHKLKGTDRLAIDISKTSGWRITFCWDGKEKAFFDVKVEDYH